MWRAGDAANVKLLLAKGAKVNVRSKLGLTPLLIATAYDGAVESARMIVKGADANAHDEIGWDPLQARPHLGPCSFRRMSGQNSFNTVTNASIPSCEPQTLITLPAVRSLRG